MRNANRFFLITLVLISYALIGSEPVAVLTEIVGNVSYLKDEEAREWGDAQINMPLYAGDQLKVEDDSRVKILFKAGKSESMSGETTYTVPDEVKKDVSVSGIFTEIWESLREKFQKSYSEERLSKYPGIRGEDISVPVGKIISPAGTKIIVESPRFIWTIDKSVKTFDISIFRGEDRIWNAEDVKPGYQITDTSELFETPGNYSWILVSNLNMNIQFADTGEFIVPDKSEVESIFKDVAAIERAFSDNPDTPTILLTRATLFEQRGYISEALDSYKRYVEVSDSSTAAILILSDFYYDHGFPGLAQRELLNAVEIPEELKDRW